MLDAVESTALWTTHKIVSIRNLADDTADHVRAQLPKVYSRELIDVLFQQPYCRINNLVDAGIAMRQTASEYLKKLSAIGVLTENQVGRERIFVQSKLVHLLTTDDNEFEPYPRHGTRFPSSSK